MAGRHQPTHGADSARYTDTLDIGCAKCGATYSAMETHRCAQDLADAIATVENAGLSVNGRVAVDRLAQLMRDHCHDSADEGVPILLRHKHLAPFVRDDCAAAIAKALIVPRCIACSEPADPNSVWCTSHRLRVEEEEAL